VCLGGGGGDTGCTVTSLVESQTLCMQGRLQQCDVAVTFAHIACLQIARRSKMSIEFANVVDLKCDS
jgi:hypothetical protein